VFNANVRSDRSQWYAVPYDIWQHYYEL